MAYQIAFDLYENATQQFLTSVIDKLRIAIPLITPDASEDNETKNTVRALLIERSVISCHFNTTMAPAIFNFFSVLQFDRANTPPPKQE